MRSILTTADNEKRSLNYEEGKRFDELSGEATELDIEITCLEAVKNEDLNQPSIELN